MLELFCNFAVANKRTEICRKTEIVKAIILSLKLPITPIGKLETFTGREWDAEGSRIGVDCFVPYSTQR